METNNITLHHCFNWVSSEIKDGWYREQYDLIVASSDDITPEEIQSAFTTTYPRMEEGDLNYNGLPSLQEIRHPFRNAKFFEYKDGSLQLIPPPNFHLW